ncbi:MAG: TetR family transcriptional regulator [Piscirickettsiaceae bacterium]|nr:MAG: TetR family transcriptional regulator [Piscirickettsiaceae bacterium]PCI68846.1 MAG: TetR family transcriptional regulator [Piscirickettsiaceae bacterium]
MTIPKQSLRRKEITTVAAKLFKNHSFDRTTVRMIAKEAGIKSGSLFHHYKDKEEILFAVIEQGLTGALETLKKEIKKASSVEDQLKAIILGQLKALHGKDKDAHIVSISEWRSLDSVSQQRLIIIRDEYEAYWQRIIDAAISEGLLDGEPRLQRLFILGSLNWTIHWYKAKRGIKIEDTAEEFYRFIIKTS